MGTAKEPKRCARKGQDQTVEKLAAVRCWWDTAKMGRESLQKPAKRWALGVVWPCGTSCVVAQMGISAHRHNTSIFCLEEAVFCLLAFAQRSLGFVPQRKQPTMSKPVFEDVFAFHGRRNRKSFFLFSLIAFVLLVAYLFGAIMLVAMLDSSLSIGPDSEMYLILLLLPGVLAYYVSTLCVGAQRCRDMGWTGWTVLVSFVPLVGIMFYILLFVAPGNQGVNAYGPDPLF
jgi:uncharacterized membrane protein YhaH (DUF805 family)